MPELSGLNSFLADLELYPDRHDRIQYLIELAEEYQKENLIPLVSPPEENRVPGCESEVFAFTKLDGEGKLNLEFAVLNPQGISAMAMAKILQISLNSQLPSSASNIEEDLVYIVFGRELSMGKSGGLTNMIRMVKYQADQLAKS